MHTRTKLSINDHALWLQRCTQAVLNGLKNGGKRVKGKAGRDDDRYPRVRFPFKGLVSTVADKICVLLQSHIGNTGDAGGWQLARDGDDAAAGAGRIVRCVAAFFLECRQTDNFQRFVALECVFAQPPAIQHSFLLFTSPFSSLQLRQRAPARQVPAAAAVGARLHARVHAAARVRANYAVSF
jgi:hypothetical protein